MLRDEAIEALLTRLEGDGYASIEIVVDHGSFVATYANDDTHTVGDVRYVLTDALVSLVERSRRSSFTRSGTAMSAEWVDLPDRRKQLRVCDDFWFVVDGNKVVLSPMGIGRGAFANADEALRQAERMYREELESQLRRGERLMMTARVGLRLLPCPLSQPNGKG